MAWKGLHLSKPARLFMRQAQLVVCIESEEVQVSLEDIAWIILDNHLTTISVALLSACAEQGIVLLTSDARHLPSALTLPFHQHHKTAGITKIQLEAGLPFRKRTWQALVRAKIQNQAAVLELVGNTSLPPLREMAARVGSGDPDNLEAQAAKVYWQSLFKDFSRGNGDDLRNKALNYGYAVMRGCLARAATASGLLPCIGIHHDSNTNAFNLIDDLIEPYRPFVDLFVVELVSRRAPDGDLELADRQALAGLPSQELFISGQLMTILHATELTSQSLVRTLQENDHRGLVIPLISTSHKMESKGEK